MNVLIADDQKDMLKILCAYFKKEGFTVFQAENGEEALEIFYREKLDLAVLDWMMPGVNGVEVCKEMKASGSVKVMMLTAKSEGEDECYALESGADDYVKKPFFPKALLVRAKNLTGFQNCFEVADITIDTYAKKLFKQGMDINATKTEYELMRVLSQNKGAILNRNQLLDIVWGIDYEGEERTVDTHIRRLREKVGDGLIKTHRGMGYSIEVGNE
ncbi:DNA-binding response regulator [Listeria newyorkensis]|uniref:DNA-binding response regulator n=1 Tax=Listeria newyorkensis TaxID=1497681 RepID=A0ABX4XL09_9LIST|nr:MULTISPECIES: response regulator transcription factor [Listeria]KGL38655.1 regulator [Listeriaceae bacterium FSL A5-0209]KGL46599.1 regulator [Listeria newyorkensis]KMT59008.1 DNA-binding response regulator [Listeria newyorkensis]PNP91058.1 DNA-binding response regulator [Listeria newyorkensis]RQW67853.1 DNA-binding response regulator [Listeria sp. SHR_NRA_18]